MISRTIAACSLLLLCLGGLPPAEAGVIDIPNGDLSASTWGPGTNSYGQTFTVPAGDSILLNYSFRVDTLNAQFLYVSQVYAWNGVAITGPSLFNSPALFSPLPLDTFTTVVFSPSIAVTQGKQYIALVTNQPRGVVLGGPADSGGGMFLKENNPYGGGEFVFKDGDPEIGTWFTGGLDADAVFHATFVPQPSTFALFGSGLGGLIGVVLWGRRGRRAL